MVLGEIKRKKYGTIDEYPFVRSEFVKIVCTSAFRYITVNEPLVVDPKTSTKINQYEFRTTKINHYKQ